MWDNFAACLTSRAGWRFCLRCAIAPISLGIAFAGGVTGCKTGANAKNNDPLFGVQPPQVAPVPPAGSNGSNLPPTAPTAAWNNVPPIPRTTSAGSTATLATLPGGRPLRINEQAPGKAPSTGPNVQPIPRDVATNPGLLTTGAWAKQTPAINIPSAPNISSEQALAQLDQRGVLQYKVDQVPEGVRLTALVPNRADPTQFRSVVATATSVQDAAVAVLQKMEQ